MPHMWVQGSEITGRHTTEEPPTQAGGTGVSPEITRAGRPCHACLAGHSKAENEQMVDVAADPRSNRPAEAVIGESAAGRGLAAPPGDS